MSCQSIPSVRTDSPSLNQALAAAKQNLDQITGRAKSSVALPVVSSNPTNAEIAVFLNLLRDRLQSG